MNDKIEKKKNQVVELMRKNNCRITKQRLTILDVMLEGNCDCCKEIYYLASRRDNTIGMATIYRMVNTLEELGVINRGNIYRINESAVCEA
ncbi:MAG: transcriptional repressor [Butyrivibrio sp.]